MGTVLELPGYKRNNMFMKYPVGAVDKRLVSTSQLIISCPFVKVRIVSTDNTYLTISKQHADQH